MCICSNEKDKVEVDEHGASQGVGVTGGKEGVGDAPKDVYESGFAFGKMKMFTFEIRCIAFHIIPK